MNEHVVLYSYFEKFGGNQSKPEFAVDLRGGSVEWASKEKSSKKHVIEVKYKYQRQTISSAVFFHYFN